MATKGQILINAETGDEYEFIETAKDTLGKSLKIRLKAFTKGELVPNHFHALQDEHFEVLNGELTVFLNGEKKQIKAGESITLHKNIPHNHYNSLDEPLEYIHTVTPALDFELIYENIFGLTQDGKMKNGKAGLVQELVTLKYLDSKSYLADIPVGVQKFLMNTIAPIARSFGYRAAYKKYSGIEK